MNPRTLLKTALHAGAEALWLQNGRYLYHVPRWFVMGGGAVWEDDIVTQS